MLFLSSKDGRRRTGEVMMLAGFLTVVSQLMFYNPVLAIAGFVVFLVGVELYLRNRKHWNDL
jgi:hypothetical protein